MTIHVRSLRVLIALLSLWLCVIVARSVPDAHRFSHDARYYPSTKALGYGNNSDDRNFAYDLVDSSLEPRYLQPYRDFCCQIFIMMPGMLLSLSPEMARTIAPTELNVALCAALHQGRLLDDLSIPLTLGLHL